MSKVLLVVICAAIPILLFVVVRLTERDFKRMEREVEDFYESEYTSTMTTVDNPCNYFFTNYGDGPVGIEPNQAGDIAIDQHGNFWAAGSDLKWHQASYFPNESTGIGVIADGFERESVRVFDAPSGLWKWKLEGEQNPPSKPSCKCTYCGCTNDHIYGTCDYCGAPLEESG